MEDAVAISPSFSDRNPNFTGGIHLFGVYDGHGCSHVATRCKDRMHEIVKNEIESGGGASWDQMMSESFSKMDKDVTEWSPGVGSRDEVPASTCRCELKTPQSEAVGSTAVVAIVTPKKIIVSNCDLMASPKATRQQGGAAASVQKPELRQPVFVKIGSLKPETSGHTVIVEVISSKTVVNRTSRNPALPGGRHQSLKITECLVGDETGTILFTAHDNQVFDDCFTTDTWEEQNYKQYVGGIMTQLREHYPDASILVFNLGRTKLQAILAASSQACSEEKEGQTLIDKRGGGTFSCAEICDHKEETKCYCHGIERRRGAFLYFEL